MLLNGVIDLVAKAGFQCKEWHRKFQDFRLPRHIASINVNGFVYRPSSRDLILWLTVFDCHSAKDSTRT